MQVRARNDGAEPGSPRTDPRNAVEGRSVLQERASAHGENVELRLQASW